MSLTVEHFFGTEPVFFHKYILDEAEENHYNPNKKHEKKEKKEPKKVDLAPPPPAAPKKDDDDIDLFGDEEVDEEAEKIKAQRVAEYEARKAAKPPKEAAKSSVVLDVKPWDDETDLAKLEESVRSIEQDGLVWGASRFIPVAFGIKKLQIQLVVEDEKVSVDALAEQIQGFEDYVQSVDIAAFNKL